MTMAKLDEEMLAHESVPAAKVQLIPVSPRASSEKAYPTSHSRTFESQILQAFKINNVLPDDMVSIDISGTAEIKVKNGKGFELQIARSTHSILE